MNTAKLDPRYFSPRAAGTSQTTDEVLGSPPDIQKNDRCVITGVCRSQRIFSYRFHFFVT